MICVRTIPWDLPEETATIGTVLLRRAVVAESVIFIESGRVVLGVLGRGAELGAVERQSDAIEGPCWLDATTAILNRPSAVDAVVQIEAKLRRVPMNEFRSWLGGCAPGVQSMMIDLARSDRHQTELALIRLLRDAQARCAAWLLANATPDEEGRYTVFLKLYKRDLAVELGIVPETLSRIFSHLRSLGFISGRSRIVTLTDPVGLKAMADLHVPVGPTAKADEAKPYCGPYMPLIGGTNFSPPAGINWRNHPKGAL